MCVFTVSKGIKRKGVKLDTNLEFHSLHCIITKISMVVFLKQKYLHTEQQKSLDIYSSCAKVYLPSAN